MFTKVAENLKNLGYRVTVLDTKEQAADYLCGQIKDSTVAFGGSSSLQEMGLFERLGENNKMLWHWKPAEGQTKNEVRMLAREADVYLSSVNGLAETGELINIDGTCNRIASTAFGHKKLYLIVGINKIAPDYDQALWRARNIAAPLNARRLNRKTPCAQGEEVKCYDCKSPERICNGLTVLWRKMGGVKECEVVIIGEELGY